MFKFKLCPCISSEASHWALQQAKANVARYYAVVGLAEDLGKFFQVLEKVLPSYFRLTPLAYNSNGRKTSTLYIFRVTYNV